ncbi:MAG: 1-acyl-sn-glycerol-3-phosphate acyltransferase [Candidatus Thiodiazotropha lotti]|uniref:Phospholipid/glycerol acyltransferase domain-containing protein n=1 Tax=Candidatus Thiodiazotropha endoloripes TaxID=1818881 RepID=A0A1E2UR29_9GAMM|nr:lysophospholipid acyltransferase family protein [Candidatus Thiodiazotropha endoloripes]MCG7898322.1 1-acyl-sn-glycerol-3-phosphate acyltransferase [Candidatus Thiodiazotropha weberae]MCG7992593.1 1-acyl-sn-glycerol-3-phosphate acyltransferase [Candidatus Thiodiazotropha lotti]MCG8000034.1 1-acyl-sn-glycerol-3-phosphate acyltransferase [Candidatus Thiodiazotropha lotti]MCW4184253.1 1-acyl-sn-glycerol-3-phosphate acyltransferase [Candidatus Thiodiazotropha weberae]MCW4191804.1 1-acyl-sn-glyc
MDKEITHSFYSTTAWLLQRLIYPLCRLYYFKLMRVRLVDVSDLEKTDTPLLLAVAPHTKHSDVVIVPASVPFHLLPVRWLADEKIFTNRLKSYWLKLWGAIPVKRSVHGELLREDIDTILEFTQSGQCIGVFPECCLVGGYFGELHQNLISQALLRKLPVYPIGLSVSEGSALDDKLTQTDSKISVQIGELLSKPEDLLDRWTNL